MSGQGVLEAGDPGWIGQAGPGGDTEDCPPPGLAPALLPQRLTFTHCPQECNNPCCNASNCTLKEGAECAHGACCHQCKVSGPSSACSHDSAALVTTGSNLHPGAVVTSQLWCRAAVWLRGRESLSLELFRLWSSSLPLRWGWGMEKRKIKVSDSWNWNDPFH